MLGSGCLDNAARSMKKLALLLCLAFAACSPANVGLNKTGNYEVTADFHGKGKTADGKDFNYDVGGKWTPPAAP
jgi:hypothetical protein